MGVYIKGMEMPKGCAFCRIGKRNGKKMVCPFCDDEWDIHDPMSADHRLDNCPLVPVPPHGRLIDADALCNRLEKAGKIKPYLESALNVAISFALTAPTIIEEER